MFLYEHSSTIRILLITSQHQELLEKYEQLLVRSMQFDAFLKQKEEFIQQQQSQITPLKNAVDQLIEEVKLLREENAALVKGNKEKDNGMLLMDTNLIENAIRPIVLGRNNFLFAGSHEAAQNAAIIYSLFATCKQHDVNAYDWLKYVLTVMPTFPSSRIAELLPQNWKSSITEL